MARRRKLSTVQRWSHSRQWFSIREGTDNPTIVHFGFVRRQENRTIHVSAYSDVPDALVAHAEIPLGDFLRMLNVSAEDCRKALETSD